MADKGILLTAFCAIALIAAPPSIAYLWAAEPIHQTFVGQVSYNRYVEQSWKQIEIGTVTIKISDVENEIVISGRDKKNRPWTVFVKTAAGLGYSTAWMADFENSGKDPIFVHEDSLNGRCVDRKRLTAILFDSEGRPSPWEITGYFRFEPGGTDPGRGVLDLGDWSNNGHAEFVQTACYGYSYQELSYTPYGLTDVYEMHNGVWTRLTKEQRAPNDTVYREIAGRNRKLAARPQDIGSFVPDYSNDRTRGTTNKIADIIRKDVNYKFCGVMQYLDVEDGRVVEKSKIEKQRVREKCEDHFVLENGVVCFGKPGIVLSRSDATEAVMDGISARAQSLLKQIIAEKIPVTLTGQLEEGVCSPTLIWASKR